MATVRSLRWQPLTSSYARTHTHTHTGRAGEISAHQRQPRWPAHCCLSAPIHPPHHHTNLRRQVSGEGSVCKCQTRNNTRWKAERSATFSFPRWEQRRLIDDNCFPETALLAFWPSCYTKRHQGSNLKKIPPCLFFVALLSLWGAFCFCCVASPSAVLLCLQLIWKKKCFQLRKP